MAMVDVDGCSQFSAYSQPKSIGLVWGLAATRRSVYIHQMNRSVKRYMASVRLSVRLSVPPWAHGSKPAAVGLLLWARRTGDIDSLLRANAGSATLSAYVGCRTKTCSKQIDSVAQ